VATGAAVGAEKAKLSGMGPQSRPSRSSHSFKFPGSSPGFQNNYPLLHRNLVHPPPSTALAKHRERLRSRGLQRLEVQVRGEDAPLLRAVAAALADSGQAAEARALLLRRFIPAPARRLKGLI
jgi:hypothetical protein